MVLETAQLVSTAVRLAGVDFGYKITHKNHPVAMWVRESRQNYSWTVKHGLALAAEYTYRYDKVHKTGQLLYELGAYDHLFPDIGQTPFVNCAANKDKGISYKDHDNVFVAYQLYLNDRWDTDKLEPTWYGSR